MNRSNSFLKPSMIISQTKKAYDRILNERNEKTNKKLMGMLDINLIQKIRNSKDFFKEDYRNQKVNHLFSIEKSQLSKKKLENSSLAYCKEKE